MTTDVTPSALMPRKAWPCRAEMRAFCAFCTDGSLQNVSFDVRVERSSWVALRVLPSSHTNPVFVTVGGRPIRASRRSAEWCLKAVDQCWSQKARQISERERGEAGKAYERAREVYRKILAECDVD